MATRRTPSFVRTEAGEARETVGHAVHGELRPSLAPEVRRYLGRGHVAHDVREAFGARGHLPVVLPDLESDLPVVGANSVARLVHAGADRDDGSEAPLAAGHGGHALVVDAVLEIDDDAVGLLQVREPQGHRPLRVVRLHGNEDRVERIRHRLQLVDPERAHRDQMLAARARQPQADRLHRRDVIRPLVDQRHVVAGLGQHATHHAADRADPDDADSIAHGGEYILT
jgi:hypothetical protein